MQFFYDTNVLLHGDRKRIFNQEQKFFISNITLQELEEIKYSSIYDQDVKYKARQVAKWLANNLDKYELIVYKETFKKNVSFLIDSNDKKIIATVKDIQKKHSDIIFYTFDINCFLLAKSENVIAEFHKEKENIYTGFSKIFCNTDEELALFYKQLNNKTLSLNLNINEYLLDYESLLKIFLKILKDFYYYNIG